MDGGERGSLEVRREHYMDSEVAPATKRMGKKRSRQEARELTTGVQDKASGRFKL